MQKPLYVYGLLGGKVSDEPLTSVEINGKQEPVIGIWHNNIGFAVSQAPTHLFEEFSREKMINLYVKHLAVIEILYRDLNFSLVPVKLGTVIEGVAAVQQILIQSESRLSQLIDAFTGKAELDLIIYWQDLSKILTTISEEEAIKSYKQQLLASGQVGQQDMIKMGEMVSASLNRRKEDIRSKVLAELAPYVAQYYVTEAAKEEIALSLSLLKNAGDEEKIAVKVTALIQSLRETYGAELDFQIVGPLPPKNFATIEFVKITEEQLETARETLALSPLADLTQIKGNKKELLYKSHPDKTSVSENKIAQNEHVQEIIVAAQLIEDYCQRFGYSSLPEKFEDNYMLRITNTR